jgi:predicted flap endonuclease-1-like 5' DNA nuclease
VAPPPHGGGEQRGASKKPAAAKAQSAAAPAKPRAALSRDASVVDAPSIGPKTAGRLNLIGVKTVGDLLEVSPDDAAARIKQGHINARVIRDWQAQALLACTVPELSALGAQLLVGAGVSSVDDLASADPDFLVDAIAMFAASDEGERALRGQAPPDRDRLKFWIEAALFICENRTAA